MAWKNIIRRALKLPAEALGFEIATKEQLARITKVPKREFMRRGINQHTLEKICRREPARVIKLAKCLKMLEEYQNSM